jgi:hypothetical protein
MDVKRLLIAVLCSLLISSGCAPGPDSKAELLTLIRRSCIRDESRLNPKPLPFSKLKWLAPPEKSIQVDELTQRWTYRFPDGEVQMHVVVETGNTWQDEDPMVFVDFKRM